MKPKIIQQGAEAIISLNNKNQILKNRIKKSYRLRELDDKLRKSRTKSEAKLLEKTSKIISTPKVIETNDKDKIIMQYINGKKLSENLEKLNYKQICKQIGEAITKLHNQDIIHSDLTTSNMIYIKNNKQNKNLNDSKTIKTNKQIANNKILKQNEKTNNFKVYLIDFGLSFHSHRIEDKAVDLHLLKQALEAKHFKIADQCFKIILQNYKPAQKKLITERIPVIESRGRYKTKL